MTICYTDQAKNDVESAFTWYELQRSGLGLEFLFHLERTIDHILDYPQAGAPCHNTLRRKLTPKFPFSVFYTLEEDRIIIHAVFDNRKNPAKAP